MLINCNATTLAKNIIASRQSTKEKRDGKENEKKIMIVTNEEEAKARNGTL